MATRAPWIPERRGIIWIDFNPQVRREMRDMHPMLVLSPRAFNDRTSIVIGLPMTTATYNASNPFAIRFVGPKDMKGYVLSHQPKSFDWRVRRAKAHPWKQVPPTVFEAACEALNQIIEI
ncbi:type II toxin-antitoxin system PemK/MazF family toxin [Variovorax sp. J22P240]|uniref:type II toxin-antitoxin system PemK/MazF family toxin n=1 Tax=Variovorax sp. J22P240 TaxID=3053514 RepID=UPI0025758C78|nr:type II toxin-antitoxin system PemK/MazF family toxin [Variovorax sp. J22P240]MDM0002799.1 type II toxin-antitoxin system PemK/MazF family toxin [Variovorax sp. J22P240]